MIYGFVEFTKLKTKGALPTAASKTTQVMYLQYNRLPKKRAAAPRAFFICRVPTLLGNRRQPQALTDCYANNTGVIELSGTTHASVFAS